LPSLGRTGMPVAGGGGYCVCVTVARGGRFAGVASGCPGTGTPLAVSQFAVEGAVDMVSGSCHAGGSALDSHFELRADDDRSWGSRGGRARASASRPFTSSRHAERLRI
jgi:hypothetical protein